MKWYGSARSSYRNLKNRLLNPLTSVLCALVYINYCKYIQAMCLPNMFSGPLRLPSSGTDGLTFTIGAAEVLPQLSLVVQQMPLGCSFLMSSIPRWHSYQGFLPFAIVWWFQKSFINVVKSPNRSKHPGERNIILIQSPRYQGEHAEFTMDVAMLQAQVGRFCCIRGGPALAGSHLNEGFSQLVISKGLGASTGV